MRAKFCVKINPSQLHEKGLNTEYLMEQRFCINSYTGGSYGRKFSSLSHPSRFCTVTTVISNMCNKLCVFVIYAWLARSALVFITSQGLGVEVLFSLLHSWYYVFGFICKFNHCLIIVVRKCWDGAGNQGKYTDLW